MPVLYTGRTVPEDKVGVGAEGQEAPLPTGL